MPISKKVTEAVQSYIKLREEFSMACQVLVSATVAKGRAKAALDAKVSEMFNELKSCIGDDFHNSLVSVDNKLYAFNERALNEHHKDYPDYIREFTIAR